MELLHVSVELFTDRRSELLTKLSMASGLRDWLWSSQADYCQQTNIMPQSNDQHSQVRFIFHWHGFVAHISNLAQTLIQVCPLALISEPRAPSPTVYVLQQRQLSLLVANGSALAAASGADRRIRNTHVKSMLQGAEREFCLQHPICGSFF